MPWYLTYSTEFNMHSAKGWIFVLIQTHTQVADHITLVVKSKAGRKVDVNRYDIFKMIHTAVRTLKSSLDRYLKITTFNLPMVANPSLPNFQKIFIFLQMFSWCVTCSTDHSTCSNRKSASFRRLIRGLNATGSVLLLAAWSGSVFWCS